VVALREIAETTLDLDVLKNALIKGLQKVAEADEPEEEIVDFLATEQDLARDAAAAADVSEDALSMAEDDEDEEELLEEPADQDLIEEA